jgi:tryptophan synthase beta chain
MSARETNSVPAQEGYFGPYGGQFVPEDLKSALDSLAAAYERFRKDPDFRAELDYYLVNYAGRPTPLFYCKNLTQRLGGAAIHLKREDLNHLGAHKVNNTLGQILLAKRMGKKKIIAETGAGQHGVATAATAALMGMSCTVFMGEVDMKRQELNVFRMRMMGAEVRAALSGNRGLKEAVDEAIDAWVKDAGNIFYLLGSAVGPHPYPLIVRDFQSVIGLETRQQFLEQPGKPPDACIACVGGGSNAIGMFHAFVGDASVALLGAEPGGRGKGRGEHAAALCLGSPGVVHGYRSYVLQDKNGDISPVHSISAGLDYPGVGPEHAFLRDEGRAQYHTVSDQEAVDAFYALSQAEGIIPALESSHALALAMRMAPDMPKEKNLVVCLSGRGDKDIAQMVAMRSQ